MIKKVIKQIIKELRCVHLYKKTYEASGHIGDIKVIKDVGYNCVKCGKTIHIELDEVSQLKGDGIDV